MPFGLAIQVSTQQQEDRLIEGWTKGAPIPMIPEQLAVVDAQGNVITPFVPAAPMYASRKDFAQAIIRRESKDRYIAHKTQVESNAAYDASRAASLAEVAGI
jgi:hypothetical protein